MNNLYDSELHKFIESYFKAISAEIIEMQTEYFVVVFSNGRKERYTYLPRIASENKEILLLAKGSKELRAIVNECSSRAAVSEVKATYSSESIKSVLNTRKCCDLCPFVTICENIDECCDFCHNYKNCTTRLENADFIRLEDIKTSKTMQVICFIFNVELSNDYSLSQKIQKTLAILIDLDTGEITNNILTADLPKLFIESNESTNCLEPDMYAGYLSAARKGAEEMLKEHMDVFKKEIEAPLHDKITAIVMKFEEEYIENYTKSTFDQLEQLQSEAVKLSEREIRGYTINCSYSLRNVIVFHTASDVRNMLFKINGTEKEVSIKGEFFLSRIDIKCDECSSEIDTAVLCENGHILCKNCSESCSTCNNIICNICDHESYLCSTCGETTCSSCIQKCVSCGSYICPSHAYKCVDCGSVFCIDCYEVCNICSTSVCKDHAEYCHECSEPVCPEHIHKCSTCKNAFCDDHIDGCTICGELICEEHSKTSAYSSKILCANHALSCAVCNDLFASNEISYCNSCNDVLCPSHYKTCSKCEKIYCSKHINHCIGCSHEYCDCTVFKACSLCGEEFCPDCLNSKGHCTACESLIHIDRSDIIVKRVIDQLPGMDKYKNFYIGKSEELIVIYSKGLFNGCMIACSYNGEIINSRELRFMDNIRAKANITRKGR